MTYFDRRKFMGNALKSAFLASTPQIVLSQTRSPLPASLKVHPDNLLNAVPENFTGLSYETMQLEDPLYFASSNSDLIGLFRQLGHGVLRLGGNTSDFTFWSQNPNTKPPSVPVNHAAPGKETQLTAITPLAITNLRGFLDATGWSCIYGLRLGMDDPENAAEEAAFVAATLGSRLDYFQIGNEPNMFANHDPAQGRSKGWSFDEYMGKWLITARAVQARVPHAKFGGPDGGALWRHAEWVGAFAERIPAQLPGALAAITTHYYPLGPPQDPSATLERLLAPRPALDQWISQNMADARSVQLPLRMTETNSCYGGGKPGLSNTLGSALWGGDYMLQLAKAGAAGINFHLGNARVIRASLSGKLTGESVDHSTAPPQDAYYSPIAGSRAAGFHARPLYYGMLLGGQFAGLTLLDSDLDRQNANVTAYAARNSSLEAHRTQIRVALFNKEFTQSVRLMIDPGFHPAKAEVYFLRGADMQATDGITLAGAIVEARTQWLPRKKLKLQGANGTFALTLPPSSAAVVDFA